MIFANSFRKCIGCPYKMQPCQASANLWTKGFPMNNERFMIIYKHPYKRGEIHEERSTSSMPTNKVLSPKEELTSYIHSSFPISTNP